MVRLDRRQVTAGFGLYLLGLGAPYARASTGVTLTAAPTRLSVPGPSQPTSLLGYDGTVPGPVLRARRGERLEVRFLNRLDVASTIHWHGVRLPNAMDGAAGVTQSPVKPGEHFDYVFVPPDAGTFWYHPCLSGEGPRQQDAGLYGVLIVDDDRPQAVDRELLLVIDDWNLGPDGQILHPAPASDPRPRITVNSRATETIALAPNERLRLRLLNAASGRSARLAMAGFNGHIVAVDGHPVDTPFLPNDGRLDLPPGGRADIIVDGTPTTDEQAGIALDNDGEVVVLLHLKASSARPRRPSALPPLVLPRSDLPAAMALQRARRVPLVVAGGPAEKNWSLIGDAAKGAAGPPLFSVKRGTLVDLGLTNKTTAPQAFHVHGHAMRILHPFDDEWQPYWVDTVAVHAGETVHTVFVADNPGKWMIGCQGIDLQAGNTETWFEVL
ncbi:oxidoreductase [Labrys miyagiensis]